ncbi:MAG TPA: family 43 glycosylhydrolase, partial [Polyangiaceae bacterium]|nr:family 43 glycosylhydrolase [Polyangiaceae bacterium]
GEASESGGSDGSASEGGTSTRVGGAGAAENATGGRASTRASGGRSSTPLNTGGNASGSKAIGGNSAGSTSSRSTNTSGGVASTSGVSAGGAATSRTSNTRVTTGGARPTTATGGATSSTNGSCAGPKPDTQSKNPLFTDVYTADPSAMVHNCTFYVHCGHDEGAGNGFVMNNWFILKSTDMVNWTRIDRALTLGAFKWANANAWAGQMITKGGKFYWFVPVNKTGSCPTNCGMAIGVAVGDSPEGPFTDYLGKPLIDDILEMANWGYTVDSDTPFTIDPTVFVDDDGQVYLQYGGFGRLSGVKLTLDGNNVSLSGKIVNVTGLTGFFEAPFLTKIRGTYYNVYARDSNPAKIDYATANNPMGPFTYRGRILDSLPTNSTDAATSHPAIAELAGQWYLVYHLSNGPNGGGTYHRMVAVDKLTIAADGTIAKIVPTSGMAF